ncbi:hypothetical protein BJ741DRAFT_666093 [Chytriomyces cf. hyalinus JEL632]|nr:hypothetical protein BJ741DRAFT_666093 [Chytriomyces cf. hyalinus JEL632]
MRDEYATKLYWIFGSELLPAPNTQQETDCLNLLYACFIEPIKWHDGSSGRDSDASPYASSPSTLGGSSVAIDQTYSSFKSAVETRDQVCLFCWQQDQPEGVPLFAQKSSDAAKDIIHNHLKNAGRSRRIKSKTVFCCALIVAEGLVTSNGLRTLCQKHQRNAAHAGRRAVDANNELLVYFADNDTSKHPNHAALAFHKAACFIWKMAGGGEVEDDDNSDNMNVDEDNVDTLLERVVDRLEGLETE